MQRESLALVARVYLPLELVDAEPANRATSKLEPIAAFVDYESGVFEEAASHCRARLGLLGLLSFHLLGDPWLLFSRWEAGTTILLLWCWLLEGV